MFTVRAATAIAPQGFVYDVQRRWGAGASAPWKVGLKNATAKFIPTAAGTFSFRSRLRRLSNGGASLYSPGARITVSP